MARRWKVLIVTSIAVFMALLDVTIVNIAFPDLRRSFPDGTLSDLSWILNAYNVVFVAALVPAGRLADRIGRRRVFLAGVLVFVGASLVCGLAGTLEILVAARVVQALGAAFIVPTSLSLVLPEFPIGRRATATALWTATGAVAAAAGPPLGGALVEWQGWRWVFFINILIGAAAFLPAMRLLRESRDDRATSWPDALGAGLLAGAVGLLALALVKGEDWGWASTSVLGGLAASVVLFLAFLSRSARHPAPVFELRMFRIRSFAVANLGSLVFGAGFYAVLLCNVLFLTGIWRYDILTAGAVLTVGPVTAALAAGLGGRLADRFGERAVVVPGGLLFGSGAAMLGLMTNQDAAYLAVFLPATLLTGVGSGLCLPAFSSAAVAELPRGRYATGVAIASCFRQVGAVVGIAGLVAVLRITGEVGELASFHSAYLVIGLTGLLTTVVALALGRVRARDVPDLPESSTPVTDPAGWTIRTS